MIVDRIHHVAYRCKDAKETMEFYRDVLEMDFVLAISEDQVPSTKEPNPYMHIFMDAGNGNILAFFEVPDLAPMGRDPNTPAWVQHIAFKVKDMATLERARQKVQARGIEVIGPTNHELFHSIYFFDPNGHRLELACDTATPEMLAKLHEIAPQMMEDWSKTKRTVRQAAWIHAREFGNTNAQH